MSMFTALFIILLILKLYGLILISTGWLVLLAVIAFMWFWVKAIASS
jgi:hypothetical protein